MAGSKAIIFDHKKSRFITSGYVNRSLQNRDLKTMKLTLSTISAIVSGGLEEGAAQLFHSKAGNLMQPCVM